MRKHNKIEQSFEKLLWNARLGTIIVVIFSALGAMAMFVIGSLEIYHALVQIISSEHTLKSSESLLIGIIGAIDLYLIGIVLMLFAFGIYELFISQIDIARLNEDITILRISSIDELKNKILKVIVMVLIVSFFKAVLSAEFTEPTELLYFAISILAVSGSVFLVRKIDKEN